MRQLTTLVSIAALALSGSSQALERGSATAFDAASVAWQDTCPVPIPNTSVKCGILTVPENWAKPADSRRIHLPFVVLLATGSAKKADPIVFLTGGPGISAITAMWPLSQAPVRADRDIVVLEPRGYGYADPNLLCAPGVSYTLSYTVLKSCFADFRARGIDLDQYNSRATVNDFEALRRELSLPPWNVMGFSYGTFLGSQYARFHPEGLRALVLDSPYPPQAGYDWTRIIALNGLDRVFEACAADRDCGAAYPNLKARYIEVLRRWQAHPVTVSGESVDGITLFQRIYRRAYETATFGRAPDIIDAADKGDLERFARLTADDPLPPGVEIGRTRANGLYLSVECADDLLPADAAARVQPISQWPGDVVDMARVEGWDIHKRCQLWPVRAAAPELNAKVNSDLPALIFSGAFDPITPPSFGKLLAESYRPGTLVVGVAEAHTVLSGGDPCLAGLLESFLADPRRSIDTTCARAPRPVHWALPH